MSNHLSSQLRNTLYRLEKYGWLMLESDGLYRAPGAYWSIEPHKIQQLVAMNLARIDVVGESTFAMAVPR